MENFLKQPSKEDLRQLASQIISMDKTCIKISYTLDDLIFAFLLFKLGKLTAISFTSDDCEIKLTTEASGRFIEMGEKQNFIGANSYTSIIPASIDDTLPILAGITSRSVLERRKYTDVELEILNDLTKFGVILEKNLKIPNYKNLPLFFSLLLSFDPYIPDISGNRENAVKALKEINIAETDRLDEIEEAKLNSLIYKIISNILKINPKITRDDIIADRAFYLEYDSLELTFALIYFLDLKGVGDIFQFVMTPNYAETLIAKFREEVGKGFYINNVNETRNYYLVETNLKSPTLVQLILLQTGKIKKNKPVYVKTEDGIYTSRIQVNNLKEGLNKIENLDKNNI